MNESVPPLLEAKPRILTPEDCLRGILGHVGWTTFFLVFGLYRYATMSPHHKALQTASVVLYGFLATGRLVALIRGWKMYVAVKGGAVVAVRREIGAALTTTPPIVFGGAVVVLTLMAVAATLLSVRILSLSHAAPWWLIVVAANAGLWAYTLFCWYRLLTARRRPPAPALSSETDPAVWPPPPTRNS